MLLQTGEKRKKKDRYAKTIINLQNAYSLKA